MLKIQTSNFYSPYLDYKTMSDQSSPPSPEITKMLRAWNSGERRAADELAVEHPRFGYRRVHALLKRDGLRVNRKRVARISEKFGLQVSCKDAEKETRATEKLAACPNCFTSE